MTKYSYYDNKKEPKELILECHANTIVEADAKLKEIKGIAAVKCSWISVVINQKQSNQTNKQNL